MNTKKTKFMLNLAFQHAELSTDQILPKKSKANKAFTSILPSMMWRFTLSEKKKLIVFYRTRTTAPTISELQEVLDNTNPVQLRIGNENLDQAFSHNIYAKYSATNSTKNSVFFAMLNGSFVSNYIGDKTILARKEKTFPFGVLPAGSQLIRPVNLNGYFKLKSFVTYGRPLARIKSNLHFNLSGSWVHEPGIINGRTIFVDAPSFGIGTVLSSNISKQLDFTIGTTSSMNYSMSTLKTSSNTKYFNQNTKLRFYWNFWKTLTYRTNLQHQFYTGFSDDLDTDYFLWEMSLGTKLFKNKKGELLISIYDVLGQNQSIARETTEIYVQDTETLTLQTYGLVVFRYRI